jgi:O-methyltransferase
MNPIKIIAPDFFVGRMLVTAKTTFDILILTITSPSFRALKLASLISTVKPRYTMVKTKNLVSLYTLARRVNEENLEGDIVECGVWNGGSAALMALAAKQTEKDRHRTIWLFDSFSGLPPPGPKDGVAENQHYFEGFNCGSLTKVAEVFRKLGLAMDDVCVQSGWFDCVVPNAAVDRISLLHIDADWYESVKVVLTYLYPKVVPGGFIVLDDYGYWPGCKRALDDFMAESKIVGITLVQVAPTGVYFQKPLLNDGNVQ